LAGGLLAAPLAAGAQSTTVRRIGVVAVGEPVPELTEARKEGMRRLGWVEGQNIVVERLELPFGPTSSARLQELARDLVRLKIEVIMVMIVGGVSLGGHPTLANNLWFQNWWARVSARTAVGGGVVKRKGVL
jgi:hypothetical protein